MIPNYVIVEKTIGPTFPLEVAAAGITNGYSFSSSWVQYSTVDLTAAQQTTLQGVIAAHDPTKQTPQGTYDATIAAGFDTGLGWKMPMDSTSQAQFSQMAAFLNLSLTSAAGNISALSTLNTTQETIQDITGAAQTVTVAQLVPVLVAYGNACKTALQALQAATS